MRSKSATTPDQRAAALADRQHGVLSTAQLLAAGLTRPGIRRRVQSGRLHRQHVGVYSVGRARLTREGWWMAAVLAAGEGAALSHGSAAALWRLRDGPITPVHVTVRGGARSRPGIVVHRPSPPLEVTTRLGIPVTTVARTLLDEAERVTHRQLERLLDEAHFLGLVDRRELRAALAAHPHRAGTARLSRVLSTHTPGTTRTKSRAEERFLAFCRRHRLPRPTMNAQVDGVEVDALFPQARLIVEIDPPHTHATATAFRHDRARDRRHTAAGYRTMRIPDDELDAGAADELRRALALGKDV